MASNLTASDILSIDWDRVARDRRERGMREERERNRTKRPPEIHVPVKSEPVEVKEKNVFTDPDSWLNRGLKNFVENTADVFMGRETGNGIVDLGAANIPGVGAGAILAAGGRPGLLDIAGMGDLKTIMKGLKHAGKISEKTAQFVMRHYDEKALKALDDYIEKFPRVGTIQVPDAYKILSEGRSGEVFIPREMSEEFLPKAFLKGTEIDWGGLAEVMRNAGYAEDEISTELAMYKRLKESADKAINQAAESGDFMGARAAIEALSRADNLNEIITLSSDIATKGVRGSARLKYYDDKLKSVAQQNRDVLLMEPGATDVQRAGTTIFNDYALMQYGKPQPLEEIEAKQLRADERKAARSLSKAERNERPLQQEIKAAPVKPERVPEPETGRDVGMAKIEADRARYERNLKKRAEENRAKTAAQQAAAEERKAAGEQVDLPVMDKKEYVSLTPASPDWRDTWNPDDYGLDYEAILGKRNLNTEQKRAAYGVDSLATLWAGRLAEKMPVRGEWPGSASYRHNNLNYGMVPGKTGVGDEFIRDLVHNVNTGNIPGGVFTLRHPTNVQNPAARAIEVDGYDLYYPVFHKKIDQRAKEIDDRYFFDPYDPKYMIKNNPVK